MQTKYVEAYSLAEFCVALQEAVLEGYSVDTSRNETYPVAYGSHLTATLVKSQPADKVADKVADASVKTSEDSGAKETTVQPAEQPAKPGRKARAQ